MSRFIITSLELARDGWAIGCEDRPTADNVAATFQPTHHGVTICEVVPVVLFMPSGSTVDAYKPLPPAGTRKPVTL